MGTDVRRVCGVNAEQVCAEAATAAAKANNEVFIVTCVRWSRSLFTGDSGCYMYDGWAKLTTDVLLRSIHALQ